RHPKQAHVAVDIRDASLLTAWRGATAGTRSQALKGGNLTVHGDGYWQAGQFDHANMRVQVDALQQTEQDKTLLPAFTADFAASRNPHSPRVIEIALHSLDSTADKLTAVQASACVDTEPSYLTLHSGDVASSLLHPLLHQSGDALTPARLQGTIKQARLTVAPDQPPRASVIFGKLRLSTPRFAAGPI